MNSVVAKKKKTLNRFKISRFLFVWGGLFLPLVSWLLFYWYTNIQSYVMAFQDMETGSFSFSNFEAVFESMFNPINERDSLARGFKNTMSYFALDIFVSYPIKILVPYFLYKRVPCHKWLRFLLLFPAMVPGVALASVYKIVIEPNGILETLLHVDIPAQGFLNDPTTATPTIMVYMIWTAPCGLMLILGGAMARIPTEILESARLDGIGVVKEFFYMILPLIWPTLSIFLTIACCQFLNASGPILLLSPNNYDTGTTTISYWIFSKVYNYGSLGGAYNLASAAGMLLTAVIWPFSVLVRKLFALIPPVEY